MRREPTEAERRLWARVRGSKLGTRFRRQHAIDRFVVDFVCFPERLVVEVDGHSHEGRSIQDAERDERLRLMGFVVARYANDLVMRDADSVVADIRKRLAVLRDAPPKDTPSPHGEGAGG